MILIIKNLNLILDILDISKLLKFRLCTGFFFKFSAINKNTMAFLENLS